MIKIASICIALCLSIFTFGQLNIPFPDSNASWTQTRYIPPEPFTPDPPVIYTYAYICPGTTDSISGNLYYELYTSFDLDFPTAHYRIDSNKVYYREDYATTIYTQDQHGVYSNGEYLLYDFNLIVGDTFELAPNEEIILTSIDSIQIGTEYYRRFNFDTYTYVAPPLEYYWIEGIGSSIGFYPYFYYFEDFLYFECFSEDSISFYPSGSNCISGLLEKTDINVKIYPNPATDHITIEIGTFPMATKGQIVDLNGNMLTEFELESSKIYLDIVKLETGIYFIRLNDIYVKFLKN